MRTSGFDASMVDLAWLLSGIESGTIALPDFQRDFTWSEDDVVALLVTVLSGWPAGSLLLMKSERPFFQLRPFKDGPTNISGAKFVLLDGQQRLTSLFHALLNKGTMVYAIDFSKLAEENSDLEEAIFACPRAKWAETFGDPMAQLTSNLLPCFALASPSSFFEWRDVITGKAAPENREALRDRLTRVYTTRLSAIHKYEFPAVVLESNLSPPAVATIFERVNRLGIRLNTFDLMVAKTYDLGWNLREQWEAARRDNPILTDYLEEDGMPLLQTIALRTREDLRQSAVLDLQKNVIHREWAAAVASVTSALNFVRTYCGVQRPEMLPYRGMLIPLAGLIAEFDLSPHQSVLKRWFWTSVFGQAFDAAANTRLVSDYKMLRAFITQGAAVNWCTVDGGDLFLATRRTHRAIWWSFLCALAKTGPSDLTFGTIEAPNAREPYSLFPRSSSAGEETAPHMLVLGFVLLPRRARVQPKIGALEFLRKVIRDRSANEVDPILRGQFLPGKDILMDPNLSPEQLLAVRRDLLGQFLSAESGANIVTPA